MIAETRRWPKAVALSNEHCNKRIIHAIYSILLCCTIALQWIDCFAIRIAQFASQIAMALQALAAPSMVV